MHLGQWLLVLLVSLVLVLPAAAAAKEDPPVTAPAGTAQTGTPAEKAQEKTEKAPGQPVPGSAPAVKPPTAPVKILKDEGC